VVDKAKERRDKETWYVVTVVNAETEQVFREALDEDDFERIERGARVPVVYRPDEVRYSQIGREASAYHFKLLESVVWLGGLLGFYFYMRGRRLPWHERRRIVEKEPGRLESEPAEAVEGESARVA
jgi:hypothetical protein